MNEKQIIEAISKKQIALREQEAEIRERVFLRTGEGFFTANERFAMAESLYGPIVEKIKFYQDMKYELLAIFQENQDKS